MLRASAFLLFAACGAVTDAPPDGAVPDAPDVIEPASGIFDVLNDCGMPGSAGGLRPGTQLQRAEIDVTAFPNARCNDGSPAVFYYRPAATPQGAARWVIQLQGGGGCSSPDSCAQRWCSVDTNFGMTQMTSLLAPPAIDGEGILYRGMAVANPLADANQVFVRYCSSDEWSATTGPLDVDAKHPVSGSPIRYRIQFNGRDILDAVISTLRRDGATAPPYTLPTGGSVTLPDLDQASIVLLAGASAGGAGAIQNADHIASTLRANNTCGADCTLEVMTLIDSIFGPRRDTLDWSTSVPCTESGVCTFEAIIAAQRALFPIVRDDSCASWHAANAPSTTYLCDDAGHVVRNHVTTPMMVRMGLIDQLIGSNYVESGASVPGVGALTPARFAQLVHDQLVALAQVQTLGEEGSAIVREPATFGPPCPDHETLSANTSVFDVTVRGPDNLPHTMLEIFGAWRLGGAPIHAVWNQGDPIDCGP